MGQARSFGSSASMVTTTGRLLARGYDHLTMTTRKENLRLPTRTPAYVDRETGAAELRISTETWDRWVDEGRIPPASPGFPPSVPRWRWADVDRRMSGKSENDADAFVATASMLRHGSEKGGRRAPA